MFRTDRIAFSDKSSSSSSSSTQKYSTKWEICRWLIRAYYCLRPENVRLECMSHFTVKSNCVDVEWNEWQSVAGSGGDGEIPTDKRYIAKVIPNWSLFNFIVFVGFLCTRFRSVPVRLLCNTLNLVWTHSTRIGIAHDGKCVNVSAASWQPKFIRDTEIFLALISRDRDLGGGRERERDRNVDRWSSCVSNYGRTENLMRTVSQPWWCWHPCEWFIFIFIGKGFGKMKLLRFALIVFRWHAYSPIRSQCNKFFRCPSIAFVFLSR